MDEQLNKTTPIIKTRRGIVQFPAYIPVTTFGEKYPLDNIIRPYLVRLAPAFMVSYFYAKQLTVEQLPKLPAFIDSGGFVSLFQEAKVCSQNKLGIIKLKRETEEEIIHPESVLELQEKMADVAFTLDFPIPPDMNLTQARKRQRLTIANAHWAIANRRRQDLPLYACVQAWDAISARQCAKEYVGCGFNGIAIGGLVPRSRDLSLVLSIVEAVKDEIGDLPLHVFGLGHPEMIQKLYQAGVHSVDSSSYVKAAADGKLWGNPTFKIQDPTITDRLHLALCNLAMATGKTLPLATSEMIFSTWGLSV